MELKVNEKVEFYFQDRWHAGVIMNVLKSKRFNKILQTTREYSSYVIDCYGEQYFIHEKNVRKPL